MAIRFFFGSGPGFVNRTQSDPGFVNPVRSGPGFVNPIRADPVQILLRLCWISVGRREDARRLM